MDKDFINAITLFAAAEMFADSFDKFKGNSAFKQEVKHRSKAFNKLTDKVLNDLYADNNYHDMIALVEKCQKVSEEAIRNVIENEVDFKDV